MIGWLETARLRYDAEFRDTATPFRETRTPDGAGGFDVVMHAGLAFPCRLAPADPRLVEASERISRQANARLFYSARGADVLDGVSEVAVAGARWSVVPRPNRAGALGRLAWLEEVER